MGKGTGIFEINHRIDILYCLQKSSLILLSKSRAIAVAPQPYLVLAGNNKGYQNTIKDAFINAIGIPVEFHSILKGTVDEANALRQVQMYTDSAASVHETEKEPMAETADSDYRLVENLKSQTMRKICLHLQKLSEFFPTVISMKRNRSNLTNLLYLPIYGIMMNVKL